jgi:hypothetical protein
VYSFTVFLKPLIQEFHAGRAAVPLAFTLHLIVGAPLPRLKGQRRIAPSLRQRLPLFQAKDWRSIPSGIVANGNNAESQNK